MRTIYVLGCRESGDPIDWFTNYNDARQAMNDFEYEDIAAEIYEHNFYEIVAYQTDKEVGDLFKFVKTAERFDPLKQLYNYFKND
jgi:hypothetical protein